MKIKFCGAATSVTGSCHMITTENHKVLLDCGQFQGGKEMEAENLLEFPFDPTEIDCVVLSHAHIDHCGRLPLLVKRGFEGKIYCTDATADLLHIMLRDSAYIHEKEAEWKTKKALRVGKEPVEPLYTTKDAEKALKFLAPILYDQLAEINDQMKVVFNDAGHILGSAVVELWVTEGDETTKTVFSGDLGVAGRPILRDPTIIKKADYVIMESTYGNRLHPEGAASVDELFNIILETKKRGGTVVIPSFAVGRTQELIYQLNRLYEDRDDLRNELDDLFVYIDSPMATNTTEVFRKNAQVFDEETKEYIMQGDNPLDFKNLKFTRDAEESKQLNMNKEPKVIISASGMCEAGRIRHHLKHTLWDEKNSIIFVGYQAEGTLGRLIVEGADMIKLFGEEIIVNAQIHNLEGFSGHADQNGLVEWLGGFEKEPSEIFLVHGEGDSKLELANKIKEKLGYNAKAIDGYYEYDLVEGTSTDISSELTPKESVSTFKSEESKMETISLKNSIKTNDINNKTRYATSTVVEEEIVTKEQIANTKNKIPVLRESIENVLAQSKAVLEKEIPAKDFVEINNIILQLEKSIYNLGAKVTEEMHVSVDKT